MSETEAKRDLAVKHYPFKWKKAQEMAHDLRHHPELDDYWSKVRLLYLELGGEYVHQLNFLQWLHYFSPVDLVRRA